MPELTSRVLSHRWPLVAFSICSHCTVGCHLQVNMYGVVNYVAKTTPLHTVVIDKCGLDNPLGADPAPVAAAPEPATLTAAG